MFTKLSISNLSSNFNSEDLQEIFSQFKGFKNSYVYIDPRTRVYSLI